MRPRPAVPERVGTRRATKYLHHLPPVTKITLLERSGRSLSSMNIEGSHCCGEVLDARRCDNEIQRDRMLGRRIGLMTALPHALRYRALKVLSQPRVCIPQRLDRIVSNHALDPCKHSFTCPSRTGLTYLARCPANSWQSRRLIPQ